MPLKIKTLYRGIHFDVRARSSNFSCALIGRAQVEHEKNKSGVARRRRNGAFVVESLAEMIENTRKTSKPRKSQIYSEVQINGLENTFYRTEIGPLTAEILIVLW